MGTYLLTWNPELSRETALRWFEELEVVAAGGFVSGRWSTGNRTSGIAPGDRAYLLRQGSEPRGIVASGYFASDVYSDQDWRGRDRDANYADVDWDAVVPMDDPLPATVLEIRVPGVYWHPQIGGILVDESSADRLSALWSEHVGALQHRPDRDEQGDQGVLLDTRARRAIEDHAQAMLTEHYRADGWVVVDRRHGHPYDAVATRQGASVFLEAKGTQGAGNMVLVTHGEVAFALDHPGECVMGIVSGIEVDRGAGTVVPGSGTLRIVEWKPEEEELTPQTYLWRPKI